ncbi:MAG: hypothetical protein AABX53_01365 [Nanoarchaeota archaeon]
MTLVEKPLERMLMEIEAHGVTSMQIIPKELPPSNTPARYRTHRLHGALVECATALLIEQEPRLLKDRFNLTSYFPVPEQVLGALCFDIVRSIHKGNEEIPIRVQSFTGNNGYLIRAHAHPSYCVNPQKDYPTREHDTTDEDLRYLLQCIHRSDVCNVAFERYRQASSVQRLIK